MIQYKYNHDFTKLTEEIIYRHQISLLPNKWIQFINEKWNTTIIIEKGSNTSYCMSCFNPLNNSYYCDNCQENKRNLIYKDWIVFGSIIEENYYFFEVEQNNLFLYQITIIIEFTINRKRKKEIRITSAYLLKKDTIINLIKHKEYSYDEFFDSNELNTNGLIYLNNLEELKNTFFQYIPLWKCKEYFKEKRYIKEIIVYSIQNKSFEYLINYKLYNLAFSNFKYKGSFIKSFGVDKSFLNFIIENNITEKERRVLELLKVKDINLIKSLAKLYYIYPLKDLKEKYNISPLKIIQYFQEKEIKYDYLKEYKEYIELLVKLNLNIKDKNLLFPTNFLYDYYDISSCYYSTIKDKIKSIGNMLEINMYEDEHYIIYPPKTIENMIDESNQQQNCLKQYIDDYGKGISQIYFMRSKDNLDKSLVTIEVRGKKVVQAYLKYNNKPDKNLLKVIKKWEKKLIEIGVEK